MTPLLHDLPLPDSTRRIAAATALYFRQLDDAPPLARELVAWWE
jgi:hypothetical protein